MDVSGKVNLGRISYVIYEHPDVSKFLEFSKDFGFEPAGRSDDDATLFFQGYGPDPFVYVARQAPEGHGKRFCGAGFTARTEEDFERACKLEGAQLRDVPQRPGGGKMVSIPDVNGYEVQVVYGQTDRVVPKKGLSNVFDGRPNVNGAITKVRKGKYELLISLNFTFWKNPVLNTNRN